MIITLKIQKLLFREVQDQNVVQFLKIFVTKLTKKQFIIIVVVEAKIS